MFRAVLDIVSLLLCFLPAVPLIQSHPLNLEEFTDIPGHLRAHGRLRNFPETVILHPLKTPSFTPINYHSQNGKFVMHPVDFEELVEELTNLGHHRHHRPHHHHEKIIHPHINRLRNGDENTSGLVGTLNGGQLRSASARGDGQADVRNGVAKATGTAIAEAGPGEIGIGIGIGIAIATPLDTFEAGQEETIVLVLKIQPNHTRPRASALENPAARQSLSGSRNHILDMFQQGIQSGGSNWQGLIPLGPTKGAVEIFRLPSTGSATAGGATKATDPGDGFDIGLGIGIAIASSL